MLVNKTLTPLPKVEGKDSEKNFIWQAIMQ
jgi:hypothetical protein